jgi:hypothetical protein
MKSMSLTALAATTILTSLLWITPIPALAQATTSTIVQKIPITPPADYLLSAIEACVGEAVTFSGTVNMVAHETFNANGGVDIDALFSLQNVFAVGQTTGTVYRSPGEFHFKLTTSAPPSPTLIFTGLFDALFISPGRTPNLLQKNLLHMTVDANGVITATVNTFSIVCK